MLSVRKGNVKETAVATLRKQTVLFPEDRRSINQKIEKKKKKRTFHELKGGMDKDNKRKIWWALTSFLFSWNCNQNSCKAAKKMKHKKVRNFCEMWEKMVDKKTKCCAKVCQIKLWDFCATLKYLSFFSHVKLRQFVMHLMREKNNNGYLRDKITANNTVSSLKRTDFLDFCSFVDPPPIRAKYEITFLVFSVLPAPDSPVISMD